MEERRKKCSGKPERKGGRFPYRPKDTPRPAPLHDIPGPDHPRFAEIRPFFMQRKDEAERLRQERIVQHRRKVEGISDARIRRELEREEAERQRGIDELWRVMRRKVRPDEDIARHRPEHGRKTDAVRSIRGGRPPASPIALAAYSGPVIDRQGRIGVYMSTSYLAARTTRYGCMRRLAYYVSKPESLEHVDGEVAFFSNMGTARHEIATGMALVEDANRAARANAKVAVIFVVQLPHDVTPEERLQILRIWCEEKLGIHNLPYVAALHKPSTDGNQRNHHGHVVTAFRPAYKVGRYQWRIGRSLRTDLDTPAMFEEFRRDFATIMTAVVQLAGKNRVYTHLSHAARGLKHKPTIHLGAQKTRLVREGAVVPDNERNACIIATNEALEKVARIDSRIAASRRRIEWLVTLKAAAAKPLALLASPKSPRPPRRARSVAAPAFHATPSISTALLAAAERASIALRPRPETLATGITDVPLLTNAPMLSRAPTFDQPLRVPSSVTLLGKRFGATRAPLPSAEPGRIRHDAREIAVVADVCRHSAAKRTPSRRAEIVFRKPAAGRRPSDVQSNGLRDTKSPRLSKIAPLILDSVPAKTLSDVRPVAHSFVQAWAPSAPSEIDRPKAAAPARSVSFAIDESPADNCMTRRLVRIAAPERARTGSATAISTLTDVTVADIARTRALSRSQHVERPVPDTARSLNLSPGGIARFNARADEVEREAKARGESKAAKAEADLRQREHERFIRFLALVALNPDWMEDGEEGQRVAPHAPGSVRDIYGACRNDHARLQVIADVRQAVLDGVHRLPPSLAGDVSSTIEQIATRLPSPPPLRDARGQLAPAVEVAMALVADNPDWVPASGDHAQLSGAVSPAFAAIVARYRQNRGLAALLAAARRHGKGIRGALDPTLARRIDQRRVGIALRRFDGDLRVTEAGGRRLSTAMVEHLAQARLHPDWIRHDQHLGLGLNEGASTMFSQQWTDWNDSRLARQLVSDVMNPAADALALSPAMRAQVADRVRSIAGANMAGPRSDSWDIDGPSL